MAFNGDIFPHYTRKSAVCIAWGAKFLKQFDICLRSFQDVQDFVEMATVQPFRVLVGNDRARVNAKSFMGMVSLDYSRPLLVRADCDSQAMQTFRSVVSKFLKN